MNSGLFLGSLGARDLEDDLETGVEDIASALPEIVSLASKVLAREPMNEYVLPILASRTQCTDRLAYNDHSCRREQLEITAAMTRRAIDKLD